MSILTIFFAQIVGVGCTSNSAKSRYVLAEKLWTDQKYAAAVSEFEKVAQLDARGKLGLQALYRGAMTQTLYLGQHLEAIRKFKQYIDLSGDPGMSWEAQKQIGEIYFSRLEQYDPAIQHYRQVIRAYPDRPEVPDFLRRIAKSHFFLWQFDEAIETYEQIIKNFPRDPMSEMAAYEIGVMYFTRGEQHFGGAATAAAKTALSGPYQKAVAAFEAFIKKYPNSVFVPQAQFGIASCLEDMDQLDEAYQQYEAIGDRYPSPNVIKIKLARIRERRAQRSH